MTAEPAGFGPVDEEPRFASAPPPDVVVPRTAPARQGGESQPSGWDDVTASADASAAGEPATEELVESLGLDPKTVEVSVVPTDTTDTGAPGISVRTSMKLRMKVKNPDGTVTETEFNPRAAGAIAFAFAVGLFAMVIAFIALVALMGRS